MKFSIGYQFVANRSFAEAVIKYQNSIGEVYFSWGDIPNGRNTLDKFDNSTLFEMQSLLIRDLGEISKAGISLNILLNANCYGANSQSRTFFNKIGSIIDYIKVNFSLKSVTTTSPLIAKFIKQNFPELEVRASVNMEIGTTEGMDYIADFLNVTAIIEAAYRSAEKDCEVKVEI